jgi:hypothetical protein
VSGFRAFTRGGYRLGGGNGFPWLWNIQERVEKAGKPEDARYDLVAGWNARILRGCNLPVHQSYR